MLVTLDMFSGRPNPTWYVPRLQVREVAERYRAIDSTSVAAATQKLGFRGLLIQQSEPGELPEAAPTVTRIAAPDTGPGREEVATARFLLSTAEATMDPEIVSTVNRDIDWLERAAGTTEGAPSPPGDLDHDGDVDEDDALVTRLQASGCQTRLTPMRLPFWSTPYVQPYNNCYNYATNFVSGTLAQPGRRSGQIYGSFSCDQVREAARRDGAREDCEVAVGVVGLGIWPGFDFHWWRLHPNDAWAHKIGWSPPQVVDNSHQVLKDGLTPATCDRGPYVEFCGYFFIPAWMWVA